MEDNRWPKIHPERKGFWRSKRGSSDVVSEKALFAFSNVKSFPLKPIIIQFWRPTKTPSGMRRLLCAGFPYALSPMNHRVLKYRSLCSFYSYCLDEMYEVDDPTTISGAPPTTAYRTGFPQVVLDLNVHRGTPLVDLALECELTCFMMVPVFYESRCVGVVEVSTSVRSRLVVIFNELKHELKRVGLGIGLPRTTSLPMPHKVSTPDIADLRLAHSEIVKALQIAIQIQQAHAITLGQVWVPYMSCLQTVLRNSHCVISPGDVMSTVKCFYRGLDMIPLVKGERLLWRAFETRQPHLCRNMYKLSDNNSKGVLALLSAANTQCTCFVICLRSSHTGEVDYLFEFFWPQSCNHLALMEDLLLTLREYLPSFKYASGAQLGDELLVVDVDNSSHVTIFSKTRASMRLKRKSIEGQSELNQYPVTNINNQEGEDDDDDEDDIVLLAVYNVDYRLFFLPSSPTFKIFTEKIYEEFELYPTETYKIEYQVGPGEWYSLTDDTCLNRCISSYRASKNIDHIKLYVQAM